MTEQVAEKIRAVLITGGNLGDVESKLRQAEELIGQRGGRVVEKSSLMRSEPWGEVEGAEGECAGEFVNQVLVVETGLKPLALLDVLQEIEIELGRVRDSAGKRTKGEERVYQSRPIDIDVLFYGDQVVESERLTIPHPRIAEREFVLKPLCELMPDFVHPLLQLTVRELLERVE